MIVGYLLVAGVHNGNWVLEPFEFSPQFLSDAVPINGFNLRVSKLREKKMNVLTKKHKQWLLILIIYQVAIKSLSEKVFRLNKKKQP